MIGDGLENAFLKSRSQFSEPARNYIAARVGQYDGRSTPNFQGGQLNNLNIYGMEQRITHHCRQIRRDHRHFDAVSLALFSQP